MRLPTNPRWLTAAPLALTACLAGDLGATHEQSVLLVTLEGAAATRFAPWGGADDRLNDLAARGTTWSRAYAPTPQLQPNVASALTGLDVSQHGVRNDGAYRLDERFETWLETFAATGWRTTTSTGTQRTDDRWGLHQGSESRFTLDDAQRLGYDGEEVLQRMPLVDAPQASWVHLRADDLDDLTRWLPTWIERHPNSLLVVAGVEGHGDGIQLDDDALRVPLLIVGEGFTAGARIDDVVGLIDVAPTLLHAVGLPTTGRPLQSGGSGAVLHRSHAARTALGLSNLEGRTGPDGRYVIGTSGSWHAMSDGRIASSGHVVPESHPAARAHATAEREAPRSVSPRRLLTSYELHRLAMESPLVLGDADAPAGSRDARDEPDRSLRLRAALNAIQRSLYAEFDRLIDDDPIQFTPAGRLLSARAARGRARFAEAQGHLEQGHATWPGPVWAHLRAELAIDRCRVDEAAGWIQAFDERAPAHADALPLWARLATLPEASAARDAAELAVAENPNHPHAPAARRILDPMGADPGPQSWSPLHEMARANALWRAGQPDAALDAQRHALALDPISCPSRRLLARWLVELGQAKEAQRLLAPLRADNPEQPALEAEWMAAQDAAPQAPDRTRPKP
jgi:hypothetical protein